MFFRKRMCTDLVSFLNAVKHREPRESREAKAEKVRAAATTLMHRVRFQDGDEVVNYYEPTSV